MPIIVGNWLPLAEGDARKRPGGMSQMASANKKSVFRNGDPCPCGSGKGIEVCDLDFDGCFRKQVPSLRPPGPVTGHSHPKCYLNGTHDCFEQISRKHYMSRAILEQLGDELRVSVTQIKLLVPSLFTFRSP
jgi:hypothetical protein